MARTVGAFFGSALQCLHQSVKMVRPAYALKVWWFLFSRHGGLMNAAIATKLTLGFFLLLIRFQYSESSSLEVQKLLYGTIWIIVLAVSSISCYLYFKLIRPFPLHLLSGQCGLFKCILCCIVFVLGVLSCYAFGRMVWRVHLKVGEMQFPLLLVVLLYTTGIVWMVHRLLATLFLILVSPVRGLWVEQLDYKQKDYVFELFPWQLFVLLHITVLFSTFHGSFFSDLPHCLCLLFHLGEILWLFMLECRVYSSWSAPPWQREAVSTNSRRNVVTGIDRLRSGRAPYPSKSHVVTGISRWHNSYAFGDSIEELHSESQTSVSLPDQQHNSLLHNYFLAYYRELL